VKARERQDEVAASSSSSEAGKPPAPLFSCDSPPEHSRCPHAAPGTHLKPGLPTEPCRRAGATCLLHQ